MESQRADIEIADLIALQDRIVFIAQTEIKSESRGQADIVLNEKPVVGVLNTHLIVSEGAQLEGLTRLEISDCIECQKILDLKRVMGDNMTDVEARLYRMLSFDPR